MANEDFGFVIRSVINKEKMHNHSHNSESLASEITANAGAGYIRRVVTIGCVVNAILMVLKLFVGYYGNSDALVADGFHSLNDFAADLIMLIFVGISFRPADRKYTYGYGKFETFSSFLMASFLIIIAVMIGLEGVESIVAVVNGEILERPDVWTIVVVIFSMLAKDALYRYYSHAANRVGSKALKANAWHHRVDALSSVATLVGVGFAYFFGEKMRIFDPIASILIAVFILIPALKLFVPSFCELMERSLPEASVKRAREIISAQKGVVRIESLKCRRNGHYRLFDVRIAVDPEITINAGAAIAEEVEHSLTDAFGKSTLTTVTTIPA